MAGSPANAPEWRLETTGASAHHGSPHARNGHPPLPRILLHVDELADARAHARHPAGTRATGFQTLLCGYKLSDEIRLPHDVDAALLLFSGVFYKYAVC